MLFVGRSDRTDQLQFICHSNRPVIDQKKGDDDDDNHDMENPPHVGMTKAQVRAKYGDPKERSKSADEGEEWIYRLNLGEAALRGLNPFDPWPARGFVSAGFTFGTDGRVKTLPLGRRRSLDRLCPPVTEHGSESE